FTVLVDAISDCQRAGLVRSEEPAADLALTAWSGVHGPSASSSTGCSTGRWLKSPRWSREICSSASARDRGDDLRRRTITPLFFSKAEGFRGPRKGEAFPEGTNVHALGPDCARVSGEK